MAFQRSYSKVWWGSDNNQQQHQLQSPFGGSSFTGGAIYSSFSHVYNNNQSVHEQSRQYSSLDYNNLKPYSGNLSRIQEDDNENSSRLWEKHDSPGSLRSQDSGFSDNEESQSTRSFGGRSSKTSSPAGKSDLCQNNCSTSSSSASPISSSNVRTIETPPTVIRRTKSEFYSPLVNVSRRISFSGASSASAGHSPAAIEDNSNYDLLSQLDRISFVNCSGKTTKAPTTKSLDSSDASSSSLSPCKSVTKDKSIRRHRRVVSRKSPTRRRTLVDTSMNDDSDDCNANPAHRSLVPEYNNETVYLGVASGNFDTDKNNNTTLKSTDMMSPLREARFTASTSTPKKVTSPAAYRGATLPTDLFACNEYKNPLLNGHDPSLQHWLDDMRMSYEQEVMSTLQTKSIAQEAFKNLTITTNTVAKIIRQLQQRSLEMQGDFDRVERILRGDHSASLHSALLAAQELVVNLTEFTKVLARRVVFFTECRADRKKFEDNIAHMNLIIKDTRISLEKQHYIQMESLLDDIQVLKRYLLITLRLVFEKLVRVIVQSVEQSKCDLLLRANINMIATLSNIDYEGFASLTDAFVQNATVRALLIVCLENRLPSVRALSLRALATVCCAPEAILQLGQSGGIEIIRDILQVEDANKEVATKRTDTERREAVSLLTQITAVWHGAEHRVEGLRVCVEKIVEGLTDIITKTNCCQTLLLCAASLNNLSRIETTSVYSIMSNETIIKLKDTVEVREPATSIFLFEQIMSMLNNMSGNKKCHSHLANGVIINFITSIFESEFYKQFKSRAETEAQRRTIKTILHTFTRLIHESSLGQEILEQNFIPIFSKASSSGASTSLPIDYDYGREISIFVRQLMIPQNEGTSASASNKSMTASSSPSPFYPSLDRRNTSNALKFNLTRQESFV